MAPDHPDGPGIVTASAQPPCCAALEEAPGTSAHDAAGRLLIKARFLPIGTSDRHTDDETAVASELYVLESPDTGTVATRKEVAGTGRSRSVIPQTSSGGAVRIGVAGGAFSSLSRVP